MTFRTQLRQVADEARPTQQRVDRLWAASSKFAWLGRGRMFSLIGHAVGVRDGAWTSTQLKQGAELLSRANDSFSTYWAAEIAAARSSKHSSGYKAKHLSEVYEAWYPTFFGPSADAAPVPRVQPQLEPPSQIRRPFLLRRLRDRGTAGTG